MVVHSASPYSRNSRLIQLVLSDKITWYYGVSLAVVSLCFLNSIFKFIFMRSFNDLYPSSVMPSSPNIEHLKIGEIILLKFYANSPILFFVTYS